MQSLPLAGGINAQRSYHVMHTWFCYKSWLAPLYPPRLQSAGKSSFSLSRSLCQECCRPTGHLHIRTELLVCAFNTLLMYGMCTSGSVSYHNTIKQSSAQSASQAVRSLMFLNQLGMGPSYSTDRRSLCARYGRRAHVKTDAADGRMRYATKVNTASIA